MIYFFPSKGYVLIYIHITYTFMSDTAACPQNTAGLEIREGTNRDIFIANLKEVHLETLEDFQSCLA